MAFLLIVSAGCKKDEQTAKQFNPPTYSGKYITGDFHQHSTYTDGSYSIGYVMNKNKEFALDWWANSEHGGASTNNGAISGKDQSNYLGYDASLIKGKANSGKMWRWQCIQEFSFPEVLKARAANPSKVIIQGVEWNVPGHEHGSVAIVSNQFQATPNAKPVAEFEFKFDNSDGDDTGGTAEGWTKSTLSGHAKTLEGIAWLQTNYANASWVIPAHPERKSLYTIADFRDMNNAGPDVCFGFESMPGHQKAGDRGEYKESSNSYGKCTYGGTGYMAAKIGGLWDAMLSEGRRWWLFANSDFHNEDGADFYPGEFQKNYTYVEGTPDAQKIADALRSGNNWVVMGDLIDDLTFFAGSKLMGATEEVTRGSDLTIYIKVHDSATLNHRSQNPELNHIDLIAGDVTGLIPVGDTRYNTDSVSTTTIIARFDAKGNISSPNGIVSTQWTDLGNGWKEIVYTIKNVSKNMYFRLRGTNLGLNEANQTDANGNPLSDKLLYPNNADKAFADLWFYSNPVFVKIK